VNGRCLGDERVELGEVVGLDLALPVVGGRQHDLDRAPELEDDPREDLVGAARQTGHPDQLTAGVAGKGGTQSLGDEQRRRLGKSRMPGDSNTRQRPSLSTHATSNSATACLARRTSGTAAKTPASRWKSRSRAPTLPETRAVAFGRAP
jgi:hypothetical protein